MFRNIPCSKQFIQAFNNTFHYADIALTCLLIDASMIATYKVLQLKYHLESQVLDRNIKALNKWVGKSGKDKIDYLNEELKLIDVVTTLDVSRQIMTSQLHDNGLLLPDNLLANLPKNPNTELSVSSENLSYRVIIDNNNFIYLLPPEPFSEGNYATATLAQRVLMKDDQFINRGWVVAKEEFVNRPMKIADECMMLFLLKSLVGIASLDNNKIVSFQKLIPGHKPDFNYHGCQLTNTLEFCINMLGEIRQLHDFYKMTHHDLKPGNMIHNRQDNTVKLIDFATATPITRSPLSSYNKKVDEWEALFCIQHFLSNLWSETEINKKLAKLIFNRLEGCFTPALTFEINATMQWLTDIKNALAHGLTSDRIEEIIGRKSLSSSTCAISSIVASLFHCKTRPSHQTENSSLLSNNHRP